MKLILNEGHTCILRFDRGEDVIAELKQYCEVEKIQAGSFTALGAASEVVLAFYDVEEHEYYTKTLTEKLEIASVDGNVSKFEGDIIIHAHGVLSDRDMKPVAGHINKLVVAATCELTLHKLDGVIERKHSDEIGLNLLEGS